jgi:hypothetical protein
MLSSCIVSKWLCRIVPIVAWILFVAAKFVFPDTESILRHERLYAGWVLTTVAPYVLLVFLVLRNRLRPVCGPWVDLPFVYVAFAALTVGLGPVILYWLRVEGKPN